MHLETMYSEIDDRVATLTLNRPDVLNCANAPGTSTQHPAPSTQHSEHSAFGPLARRAKK